MNAPLTRRELLKLSGALAASSLLAACSNDDDEKKDEPEEIEPTPAPPKAKGHVVVMHFLPEFSEDHVAAFQEEHPNITVELLAEDLTRFFAMYAVGNPPDLLRVQAPAIPQYLVRNLLYDLTPYFQASDTLSLDDLAPANDYYKANGPLDIGSGPIYGMCKDFSPDCTIFVYKPLFEENGLAVPSDETPLTYQEIAEFSEQLTTFEGDRTLTFGFSYEAAWVDRYTMNMLAELDQSLFSPDFNQIVLQGNKDARAIAKYYFDMAEAKLCQSSTNPSPGGWHGNDFGQGILAMLQYGFWFGAIAETEVTAEQVIMIPGPTWSGVHRDPAITATGMIMTATTKVPDAAWKVFEYYNGGAPAVERAGSGWGVPALKSMYELMPNTTEYEQQKLKVLMAELAEEPSTLQFNPFLGEETVATIWNALIDRALVGEFTFDEMLANIEAETNAAIADGIDRVL